MGGGAPGAVEEGGGLEVGDVVGAGVVEPGGGGRFEGELDDTVDGDVRPLGPDVFQVLERGLETDEERLALGGLDQQARRVGGDPGDAGVRFVGRGGLWSGGASEQRGTEACGQQDREGPAGGRHSSPPDPRRVYHHPEGSSS